MPKVYGIAAGAKGQGYKTGDIFEVNAWRDGGATEPEQAQDVGLVWVDVLAVFMVDGGGAIVQNSYDFLEFVPRID